MASIDATQRTSLRALVLRLLHSGSTHVAYRPFSRRSERRLRELQRDCDRLQRRIHASRRLLARRPDERPAVLR